MWRSAGFGASREARTTIRCKACGEGTLTAHRFCREVRLKCEECGKSHPVEDYVAEMDDALETFMENVFCDRI